MISKLVKIANKLDSLGLTAEADVLDRFVKTVVAQTTTIPAPAGSSERVKSSGEQIREIARSIVSKIPENYKVFTDENKSGVKEKFLIAFYTGWTGVPVGNRLGYSESKWNELGVKLANDTWNSMESVRSETYSGISSTKSDAQKWESYIKRVPVGSAVKTSWETYGATLTGNASYENFRLWLNGLLARANLTEITAPRIISYMAALADAKTLDDKLLKLPAEKRPGESLTLKIYRAIKEKNLDEVKRISSLIKQYNQDSEHTDPKQFDRKDTTPST